METWGRGAVVCCLLGANARAASWLCYAPNPAPFFALPPSTPHLSLTHCRFGVLPARAAQRVLPQLQRPRDRGEREELPAGH